MFGIVCQVHLMAIIGRIQTNEKISLVLNPNLEWKKVFVKVQDAWVKVTPKEGILPDDFLLEIGKLWEIDLSETS